MYFAVIEREKKNYIKKKNFILIIKVTPLFSSKLNIAITVNMTIFLKTTFL